MKHLNYVKGCTKTSSDSEIFLRFVVKQKSKTNTGCADHGKK